MDKIRLSQLKSGSDVRGVAMDPQEGQTLDLTNDGAARIGAAYDRRIKP